MTTIQMPIMMKRLKAAEPTIVPGPRLPATKLFPTISMAERRISGADDPNAIKVRLATVSFQTLIVTDSFLPVNLFLTMTSPAT